MSIDTEVYNSHYNYIVVAHLMADMENEKEITTGFSDYEEYAKVVNSVVEDWVSQIDIKDDEEMGYISAYATRRLRESFF